MMKNFNVQIFSLILVGFFFSCTEKGQNYSAVSYINNTTSRDIKIRIWENGLIRDSNNILDIDKYSKKEVFATFDSKNAYPFTFNYADSVEILFENNITATHLVKSFSSNKKALSKDSLRNIFWGNGWEKNTLVNTSKALKLEYIYTFTEQDYLNAQK